MMDVKKQLKNILLNKLSLKNIICYKKFEQTSFFINNTFDNNIL